MELLIGYVETRNFTFLVVATCENNVRLLLDKAWSSHCAEFNADPNLISEMQDDMTIAKVRDGSMLRDWQEIG